MEEQCQMTVASGAEYVRCPNKATTFMFCAKCILDAAGHNDPMALARETLEKLGLQKEPGE